MHKRTVTSILLLLSVCAFIFAASAAKSPANLDAVDLNGNKVTAEVFKDYDVTMINIFTTWCGYCINEMPDLNKLYEQLPKNANLIAICADAYDAPDDLAAIMEYFKLKFPVLKMTKAQVDQIYGVLGYPTTIFVDKDGNLLKAITGAPKNALQGYGDVISSLLGSK